jgi:hypothetical protein
MRITIQDTDEKNFIQIKKLKFDVKIGNGGYSEVYSGTYTEFSEKIHKVAIKVMDSNEIGLNDIKNILYEL